ncbi:neuromedin-U receptor 1-like [Leguminivora glycinivorella]|uniref:neuromedin-U receptor 1-like n=1 Tax=Leguminivora glycinivorella TaxID=1035111 RepID=UPI00200BCD68|nr:neuromedin-U receptor 1-like [Leguminivora glycinivorella]
MLCIFLSSLFGNLLTCFVIYVDKSMHTVTNYYLFNLAAADLILTFAMLIEVYDRVINPGMAMTVSFYGCWLPFNAVRLLICLLDTKQLVNLGKRWRLLFQAVNFNSWISSVLNPVLFSIMSTKFRKSLKNVWNIKIKRTRK